jgi:hypothetical protein
MGCGLLVTSVVALTTETSETRSKYARPNVVGNCDNVDLSTLYFGVV